MAQSTGFRATLTDPLIRQNPVTLQILGICSALAVTTTLATALTMSVSLTVVLTLAAGIISLIRRHIPDTIRLIVQIVIVAALVIVIDQILQAYFAEISRALSVYVGLITTNCLVLGRTEAYARHHAPLPAMVDAFGNGLGYSLVLLVIATIRELFGKGELFGVQVLPLAEKLLTAQDWAELDAAFAANRDPLTGHEPDDAYRPLFTKILSEAPAPVGLGPAR